MPAYRTLELGDEFMESLISRDYSHAKWRLQPPLRPLRVWQCPMAGMVALPGACRAAVAGRGVS